MSNEPLNVDINGMKRAVPHFEDASRDLANQDHRFTDMYAQLRAAWQTDEMGGAPDFFQALDDWQANCVEIQKELHTFSARLQENIVKYEQTHQTGAEAGSRLKGHIGSGLPGF